MIFVFVADIPPQYSQGEELASNGVLAKGTVVGGKSTKSTRRFKTTTSYTIDVTYYDSLNRPYTIDESVNSSEFGDVYEGARVDVIYSKKYPSLGKVVFDVKELSKFIKIPDQKLTIISPDHILDGNVPEDSLLNYFNSSTINGQSQRKDCMQRETQFRC